MLWGASRHATLSSLFKKNRDTRPKSGERDTGTQEMMPVGVNKLAGKGGTEGVEVGGSMTWCM